MSKKTVQAKRVSPVKKSKVVSKNSQIPHSSTALQAMSQRGALNDVQSLLSGRSQKRTQKDKEMLMQAEWEWVQHEDSLELNQFYRAVGVPRRTYERLVAENDEMKYVHEVVKDMIGERRQRLAFFPKRYDADANTIKQSLRNYHVDWRDMYNEDQKNKDKDQIGNLTVVLDRVEETDVPVQPDEAGRRRQEIDG